MSSIIKKCKNCENNVNSKESAFCSRMCFSAYRKSRTRGFLSQEDIWDIVDLYVNKQVGIPTIQKKYNTYQRIIQSILEEHGVTLRSKSWVLTNRPPFRGHKFTADEKEIIRQKAINAYIKDPTLKDRIRKKTLQQIADGKIAKCNTSIEKIMAALLLENQIAFEYQKIFGYWCYDFYIASHKLFIECDGDYWHGHPKLYAPEQLNETQKTNIRRGKAKETYARNRGYSVIRFWEMDLNNNLEQVKLQLCNALKIS